MTYGDLQVAVLDSDEVVVVESSGGNGGWSLVDHAEKKDCGCLVAKVATEVERWQQRRKAAAVEEDWWRFGLTALRKSLGRRRFSSLAQVPSSPSSSQFLPFWLSFASSFHHLSDENLSFLF